MGLFGQIYLALHLVFCHVQGRTWFTVSTESLRVPEDMLQREKRLGLALLCPISANATLQFFDFPLSQVLTEISTNQDFRRMLVGSTFLHAFMEACVSAFGTDDSEMGSGSLSCFSSLLPKDDYTFSHLLSLLHDTSFHSEWDQATKQLLSKALGFYLKVHDFFHPLIPTL